MDTQMCFTAVLLCVAKLAATEGNRCSFQLIFHPSPRFFGRPGPETDGSEQALLLPGLLARKAAKSTTQSHRAWIRPLLQGTLSAHKLLTHSSGCIVCCCCFKERKPRQLRAAYSAV